MSKKQLGGEESYLNNFVDEVMGSFNMKGGKFQKGGVVELSPMLVSLMTLGMRVAVDPKLSAVLKKHNKLNGGSGELISKAAISNLISGKGSFAGGNIDSSDMFSTDVLPPSTGGRRGGRRGGKLSGGGEAEDLMPSVSPDDEIADAGSLVEGGGKGKKGKKATKAKKGKKTKGGDGGEEIEEFSNLMSGGEADLEEMFSNMQDAMDDPAVGGGKGKKGKKAAKAAKAAKATKATKAKKGKKTKGGDGEGSDAELEEMFSNMQDSMDTPVVGGKTRGGKKGGSGIDNIFSFYK